MGYPKTSVVSIIPRTFWCLSQPALKRLRPKPVVSFKLLRAPVVMSSVPSDSTCRLGRLPVFFRLGHETYEHTHPFPLNRHAARGLHHEETQRCRGQSAA